MASKSGKARHGSRWRPQLGLAPVWYRREGTEEERRDSEPDDQISEPPSDHRGGSLRGLCLRGGGSVVVTATRGAGVAVGGDANGKREGDGDEVGREDGGREEEGGGQAVRRLGDGADDVGGANGDGVRTRRGPRG